MEKKPWYKKVKLMTALGAVIINAVTILAAGKLTPEVIAIISSVVVMAIALITGHSYTDTNTTIASMTTKK